MNWLQHILYHVSAQPGRPAIVLEDRVVTYEMLGQGITRCANRLAAAELGDRGMAAVLIANPTRHLIVCLALTRLGIAALSLEHGQLGIQEQKVAAVLGDAMARPLLAASQRYIEVDDDWFAIDLPAPPEPAAGFADGTAICHASLTAGTTGHPKPVPISVDVLGEFVLENVLHSIDLSRHTVLCLPGLGSGYGYNFSVAAMAMGRTLCIAPNSEAALRMIELYAVDFVLTSTEQLLALTKLARLTGARLDSLRCVRTGGSLITRTLLEAATTYVCRDILCDYGASEAGLIARATVADALASPGLAGRVFPWIEVAILDANGDRCPSGRPGLVNVRRIGHALPTNASRSRHDAIPWIELGDMGWMDADSQLHVVGRTTDTSAPRRHVSPAAEVEHAAWLEFTVADVAAIELESDADPSEPQIWLAVVGRHGGTTTDFQAVLKARGLPGAIRFFDVTAIPRGNNGKVRRGELKAMLLAASVGMGRS